MKQTRVWAALGALALSTSVGIGYTWAQDANPLGAFPAGGAAPAVNDGPRTVYFWSAIGGAENVHAGKWGNGDETPARTVDYEGHDSLQVTTHSFGEGARFDLKTGVPIDPYRDKGYLRIRVRFSGATGFGGGAGGFGGAGGVGGTPGVLGGGGAFGGRGGRGGGGGGRGRGRGGFGGVAAGGGDLGGRDLGGGEPGGGDLGGGGGLDGDGIAGGLPTLNAETRPRIQAHAQMDGGGALPGIPGGGFGGRGGLGGGGFGGRGGFGGGFGGGRSQSTTITQIQATLMLDQGVLTTYIPIDLEKSRPDSSGWYLFAVPINSMRSTPGATGSVRRLILTSDADETFYLAQAALVVENGQLTLSVRQATDPIGAQIGEITVRPGPLTLMADVEAGAADPEVTWNFDADNAGLPRTDAPQADMMGGRGLGEAGGGEVHGNGEAPGGATMGGTPGRGGLGGGGDPRFGGNAAQQLGPRVDARGLTATFTYPNEEQDYRVEVTVRDRSGHKKPITSSLIVKVRS